MSALLLPALAAGSSGQGALYVGDVFSAYTYTGNGLAKTINNWIDLAGKGGMVWTKFRAGGPISPGHYLIDTVQGGGWFLSSDSTSARGSISTHTFSATGYTLPPTTNTNLSGLTYVGWTFRKAPKFFDVVTYTGDGSDTKYINHSLNCAPGIIFIKRTDSTSNWWAAHRHQDGTWRNGYLNLTDAVGVNTTSDGVFDITKQFNINRCAQGLASTNGINVTGATYVAYLFAHDPSADGIIQCGSFTTDSGGNATANLGWANGSQFAMIKAASTTGDWEMYDTARTSAWSGNDARLRANLSNAEDSVARVSASGASITFAGLSANSTYIYMVVRSPS